MQGAGRFLSRNEVATLLGVTPSTVTRWAKLGLVPAALTPGGHHRYFQSDIRRLADELAKGRLPKGRGSSGATAREAWPRVGTRPQPASNVPGARLPFSGNGLGDLVEIRWHGRGGQGVVTASQVLAEAALQEDRHFQAFPEFGPERTGAPVRAFTRLSSSPIPLHCPVAHPDIAVVLDPTLLSVANLFEGLKEKGTVVINTPLAPRAVKERLPGRGRCKVVTVDATGIAMEAFNRNMPNMPILGALLRASPLVSKESCLRALQERLGARLETAVVEANAKAFERGYAEARID